jgi:hypothetical protein
VSQEQDDPNKKIDPKELRAGEYGDAIIQPEPKQAKNDTIMPPLSKPNG